MRINASGASSNAGWVGASTTALRDHGKLPPVYTYQATPGVPQISAIPFGAGTPRPSLLRHAHIHDFLALAYFERDGGALRLGNLRWEVEAGDVFVIPPGEVVAFGDSDGVEQATGWAVSFSRDAIGPHEASAFLSWRAHPLLFPFVSGTAGGSFRLQVAPSDRPAWSSRLRSLALELGQRQEGYREAALAHLTLLLVHLSRLTLDVAGTLRLRDEPVLAEVFTFIEEHFRDGISLSDVAYALSLTPGYLTTIVRQKTGRTVQDWIAERRMVEARRLLVETDLAVNEIGHQVGYRDAGYFARVFRRAHGITPLNWRCAGRP